MSFLLFASGLDSALPAFVREPPAATDRPCPCPHDELGRAWDVSVYCFGKLANSLTVGGCLDGDICAHDQRNRGRHIQVIRELVRAESFRSSF